MLQFGAGEGQQGRPSVGTDRGRLAPEQVHHQLLQFRERKYGPGLDRRQAGKADDHVLARIGGTPLPVPDITQRLQDQAFLLPDREQGGPGARFSGGFAGGL